MEKTKTHSLQILLHGEAIGALNFFSGEQTFFVFHENYIENSKRPVLSLSFKNKLGHLITSIKPSRIQIPPFFSNLLPEGHLRDYLAKRAGVHPKRECFLLQALGHDLSGAVTVNMMDASELHSIEHASQLADATETLRFSLAGVQIKFSAVMETQGGLTIPAEGVGGQWIVKLPSARFDKVPENEFSMMTLAKKMGMDIPEISLVPLSKISGLPKDVGKMKGVALVVKRFDRSESGPIHMEDFAQIFGLYPDDKYGKASYKNIAEVLCQETGKDGIVEFTRRLVFNTLIGNADMHLKNWSVIYPNRRQAQLSPGYDFVSTISYLPDDSMGLNFVKSKKMTDLSLEQLSYLSATAGLPEKLVLKTAKETIQRFREIWKKERKHLLLSASSIQAIEKNVAKIPLAKEI